MIHIALCTDTYYMMACGPCLVSIFEHHAKETCHVYIVTKSLPESDVKGLHQVAEKYGQQVTILQVGAEEFRHLKVSEQFRESVYYRFLLPELLPELDKIIYLDCDILVNGSLEPFWQSDINGYACGVVEDQEGDDILLHNRIGVYTPYFNSGVLLMNLDYWREHNLIEQLVDFIYENPEKCIYPDQDAMNVVLQGKVKFMPYGYNFQDLWYSRPWQDIRLHASKFKEVEEWKDHPVVIHFAGRNKPWKRTCKHPYRQYYLECLAKTPWTVGRYKRPKGKGPNHKHIVRFNRAIAALVIETLAFIIYICLNH